MIGAVATAVIIAIILMIVIGKMMGWFKFGNKKTTTAANSATTEAVAEIPMEDVVGISEEAAIKILKDAGFTNVQSVHETNTEKQEGYVFEQSIAKGVPTAKDAEIIIKVSAGAEEKEIPDVANYEDNQAVTILKEAGFEVTHAYEYSEDVEKDKVIRTEPAGKSMAKEGSKITLVVSNGKEEKNAEVPNLTGYTQAEAENALATKKLKVGNVTHEKSDNVAEGYVIRQGTKGGTEVPEGTAIDFVISDGAVTYSATLTYRITAPTAEGVSFDGHPFTVTVSNGSKSATGSATIGADGTASVTVTIDGLATSNEHFSCTVNDGTNPEYSSEYKSSDPSITYREN